LNSFLSFAFDDQWLHGLKTFLSSPSAHFLFTSLSFDEQSNLMTRMLRACSELEDSKVKRHFWQGIVEEVISKRPYAKHLALYMLEKG
jgi:hypothetical protein